MRPDEVNNNIRRVMAEVERVAEHSDSGRIMGMTLSDDVAELERRCAAAEKRVEEMTADPTIDFVTLHAGESGIEIEYCIKDWEWGDEVPPRIDLQRALALEVTTTACLSHPEDLAITRTYLIGIEAALEKHLHYTRWALAKANAMLEAHQMTKPDDIPVMEGNGRWLR